MNEFSKPALIIMVNSNALDLIRVYEQRKKNFKKRLIGQLNYLGFASIIIQYLKFGSSIWVLLLRLFIQSLLSSPFPSEFQMRRLAMSTYHRQIPGLRNSNSAQLGNPTGMNELSMPGAFGSINSGETASSESTEDMTKRLRTNISWFLFHCSLSFNCLLILFCIIWPKNFKSKLEDFSFGRSDLQNTPSPFNNDNGLIGGEFKGSVFIQLIGERLPSSNFWGNVHLIMFDFLILICQFGLFCLTCFEDEITPKDDHNDETTSDAVNTSKADGYGGDVVATVIHPSAIVDTILNGDIEEEEILQPGTQSMV